MSRWLDAVAGCLLAALLAATAGAAGKGEGTDVEIGGPGPGQGTFLDLRDITFDPAGHLYVLDGGEFKKDKGGLVGNFLVQKFTGEGKFVSQFSIRDDALGEKNDPTRLAVDSRGHAYVTQPRADLVREYGPDGRLVRDYPVAGAYAICRRTVGGQEQVVVCARPGKRQEEPAAALVVIRPDGSLADPVTLGRPLVRVEDLACDARGNLYALAETHQIYQFAPEGKLITVIGGGTHTRIEDGSELLHTVAVDSKGGIHSITWGNPGWITRFDAAVTTVTRRRGQFFWFDPWGTHSGYTPFAISPDDRLWIGSVGRSDGKERYHFRPCVLRTEPAFFDPEKSHTAVTSGLVLGLMVAIEVRAPYNVVYDLAPVAVDFVVRPGVRRVSEVDVSYNIYDWLKREVGRGAFALKLADGQEARKTVSFTPPRWGWYSVQFQVGHKGNRLTGLAAHVGATPRYEGLPVLAEGASPGGWEDALRQAFAGLPSMRVHPKSDNLDRIEKAVEACAKYGVTLVAQFENKEHCEPEFVRKTVERFKGRIRYWEIINEPNFSCKPDEYAAIVRRLRPIIRAADPDAKVLAPAVCGIQLPWHEAFYQAAGKDAFDILSVHDYEGHESVDPFHWRWKYGELRKLMAAHGDAGKPVWQTERAIGGIRGKSFLGVCQAVRVTLHRDLLASLGIPNEDNFHYYLNEAGYGDVPTYLWSAAGPHPGALATRTRFAMIRGRTLARVLDFGPTGNKMFLGLEYAGDDGSTVILRNLGTRDTPMALAVTGGDAVEVVDAFGNASRVAVADGRAALVVSALPTYLRLAKGQAVAAPQIDFGANIAPRVTFAYSAGAKGDAALLADGRMQVVHAGNPDGGTDGKKIWTGDIPSFPQTLEMTFARPETVARVLLFGVRADNQFCALLDFDLECHDGTKWVALEKVRTPLPPSDLVDTPQCKAVSWDRDENFFACEFGPVTTSRLRLVVRRTTYGFLADEAARAASSSDLPPKLMLREVEVYAPSPR